MSDEYNNVKYLQKYMIHKIAEYFARNTDNLTSRYVLNFDSLENIVMFDRELRAMLKNESEIDDLRDRTGNPNLVFKIRMPYVFYNDEGGVEYEATQVEIGNTTAARNIVFIPDCDQNFELLGDAFKNCIRNKFVDDQEDKILFYLSVQNIASVLKTTENFQKQGMPLSIDCVFKDLKSRAAIIQTENQFKTVLYALNKIKANKPVSDHSLMEFAPVIRIIEAQKLEQVDFHDLHMFQMSLADVGKKDSKLAENYKLYRDISLALEDQELDTVMYAFDKKIISDIQKAYENDKNNWDSKINFDQILKHKLADQKKFKIEQPVLVLDAEDNELDHGYYLNFKKGSTEAFIIETKNYPKKKSFKIDVKFTQKAGAKWDTFRADQENTRGTYYKIIIEAAGYCQTGKVIFTGGKENKTFTMLITVIDVPQGFLADSCIGVSMKRNVFWYKLRATDYAVLLGERGEKTEIKADVRDNSVPLPVNTAYQTKILFSYPEDEVVKDRDFTLNLDDSSALLNVSVKFEESSLKTLDIYSLFNKCYVYHDTFELVDGRLENKHKRSEKFVTEEFIAAGRKYSLQKLLMLEDEMIRCKYKCVTTMGLEQAKETDCEIPEDVETAYNNICEYYINTNTIPSASMPDKELTGLYQAYINVVLNYIHENSTWFQDKQPLLTEILNLFHLGSVRDSDGLVWLSPLSPLSIAYQYELCGEKNKWMDIDQYLYTSLGLGNLMPFLTDAQGSVLQYVKGNYPLQWSCYYNAKRSVKGDVDTYCQKIEDYYNKFSYLFDEIPNAAFKINIIGIPHTSEIIRAFFKLFRSKKINENMFAVEINYYFTGTGNNEFDRMSDYDYVYHLACQYFGSRNTETAEAFCNWYYEKVKYYARFDDDQYEYAHITFCTIQDSDQSMHLNTISDAKSGIMLNGLISDVPSSLDKNSGIYKYGFGAQYAKELIKDSLLLQLANGYNELADCRPGSPAARNLSIAQGVQNTQSEKLSKIYKSSNWVVFVEPKIDLDFFIEQSDTGKDLIIIHYPDKNVTSSGYSSITVTQKSHQYVEVIKEYLEPVVSADADSLDIKRIIKNFNAFSGEWLMNFINNNQIDEKISLVSAIAFCRKYFELIYSEYVWVPVALDEVLRVTGAIGGSLTNVLFSKKVLISRGIIESQNATSDDLLMAGIKIVDKEVFITYIPVEVKHGKCSPDTRREAHSQVCNTAYLLRKSFLNPEELEAAGVEAIDRKIYRNYMIQHVVSNIEKMLAYKIAGPQEPYQKIIDSEIRIRLLNDQYTLELSFDTDAYAFYFAEGQNTVARSRNAVDKVIEISAPLTMMYEFLADTDRVDKEVKALEESDLLSDQTIYDINVPEEESDPEADDQEGDLESEALEQEISELMHESELIHDKEERQAEKDHVTGTSEQHREEKAVPDHEESGIRILIGTDAARNKIYWEFGNKSLANRHLLITGTSGQGKTYSIQTMLYELSASGVPAVIFDYTEGFMKTQLEKIFVDELGDRINEHIVYSVGVPINPFARHEIEIAGMIVKEKPADVASRLADIFAHVYDFGDQQYSAIFTAALNGIISYGDHMSMRHFQSELEQVQESNKAAKTVISKMEPFFHTISFDGNHEFDWGKILYGEEPAINIFQLTLINREMQVIITELMLWDAWYYTKKYGNKDKPFVTVLDEAQNLSHKSGSPSAVILTEGRKFGWSAWFATQSLKILKDEEVVRLLQVAFKLYFKPTDDEIVKIAKQLDPTGESNWTREVKNLKKGTCIVAGDRMKPDGTFGGTQPAVVSVEALETRI